jgi:hypothetical protein
MNKQLPRIGEWVMSPHGRAKVIVGHPLKNAVSLLLESHATVEISISQVTRQPRRGPQSGNPQTSERISK